VQAHTNLTEIDQGLDLLWRNNIDSKKVVLGLGFYGRAFTLQDPNCSKPGCPFSGGAKKGRCTGESGILSNSEIQDVIAQKKVTPTLVEKDAIKYITWDSDQWVSYDDDETLRMKRDYANELCLGGTMIWALDLDKPGADTSVNNLVAPRNNLDSKWNTLSSKRAVVRSNAMTLGLFWTSCQPMGGANPCPTNYRPLVWGHGKVFDADLNHLTGDGCHGKTRCRNKSRLSLINSRWWSEWLSKSTLCCSQYRTRQASVGPRRKVQSMQQQVSAWLGDLDQELPYHRTEARMCKWKIRTSLCIRYDRTEGRRDVLSHLFLSHPLRWLLASS
jgi:hypothetical protein